MDLSHILQLIGGIGLFLYGMKYLGASLERLAAEEQRDSLLHGPGDIESKGIKHGCLPPSLRRSGS